MNGISWKAVYGLWKREMIHLKRYPSRIIGSLSMPLLFLIFLGFGFGSMNIEGIPGNVDYIQYLVPGIIGMTMLFSSSFAGLSILWDKEHGFLKEILIAPVSRLSIVIGRIVGGGTMSIIQGFLIMVFSLFIGFSFGNLALVPVALLFIILISFTFIGMGMIFASKMEDAQGFGMIINLVMFPLFFLSGAIYPVENLPGLVKYVSYLNPLTYGVDGLRASLISVSRLPVLTNLLVLAGFCIVLLGLGTYFFRQIEI